MSTAMSVDTNMVIDFIGSPRQWPRGTWIHKLYAKVPVKRITQIQN
jgi:hypothetical protein